MTHASKQGNIVLVVITHHGTCATALVYRQQVISALQTVPFNIKEVMQAKAALRPCATNLKPAADAAEKVQILGQLTNLELFAPCAATQLLQRVLDRYVTHNDVAKPKVSEKKTSKRASFSSGIYANPETRWITCLEPMRIKRRCAQNCSTTVPQPIRALKRQREREREREREQRYVTKERKKATHHPAYSSSDGLATPA